MVQQWILVISGAATMISIATGVWLSLRDYRIKLRAEARAQESAELEAEVRLHSLFSDLMTTANGRSGYVLSENAVDFLLKKFEKLEFLEIKDGFVTIQFDALYEVNRALRELGILDLPVGSAAQNASVAAIYSLAAHYPRLRITGLTALESLQEPYTTPVAREYMEMLKSLHETESIEVAGSRQHPQRRAPNPKRNTAS
ncbi:hypothetical protein SAMN06272721_11724 [Arthrobacter sp. P2b]|nr:hypothetical protein SAMN06272721_11724 [Arthrobacter sp. P2b]